MSDPDTPNAQSDQPAGQQIRINVEDAVKHGIYANFLVVSHSPHEFTLDFCQVLPGGDGGVQADVVTRLKVAPTMVGRIIRALNTNMNAYEDKYGLVKDVG